MKKVLRAGISFSDERTQAAIVEFQEEGNSLTFLEEFTRTDDQPPTALSETIIKALKAAGTLSSLTVSIDTGNSTIQVFPIDANLPKPEQEEHLNWEWKNYFPDYSSEEYVQQNMELVSTQGEETKQVLSMLVKRSLLTEVQQGLVQYHLVPETIDFHINSAEQALRFIYPDIATKNVALIGISALRLDVCVYSNGKLSAYKYGISFTPQTAVEFLANELLEYLPEALFVYGSAVSYEWTKALKSSLGVVIQLNPFRKFRIVPEVKNFSRYLGSEQRFCGCIGSILGSKFRTDGK